MLDLAVLTIVQYRSLENVLKFIQYILHHLYYTHHTFGCINMWKRKPNKHKKTKIDSIWVWMPIGSVKGNSWFILGAFLFGSVTKTRKNGNARSLFGDNMRALHPWQLPGYFKLRSRKCFLHPFHSCKLCFHFRTLTCLEAWLLQRLRSVRQMCGHAAWRGFTNAWC